MLVVRVEMDTLNELLARQYPFRAVVEPTGGWSIVFPDLPGCTSFAATWEEIGREARTAFTMWMESEHEQGHPIPAPTIGDGDEEFDPEAFAVPAIGGAGEAMAAPETADLVRSRRSG
jgi:predicted RNase H-like HicB family nuclease